MKKKIAKMCIVSFLMSHLKNITEQRKMFVRIEIKQEFYEEGNARMTSQRCASASWSQYYTF